MNWFCVHTKPGKEQLVEHFLNEELSLETYYPRLKRKKTIRRVRREVIEPLFPRYLFCRFDQASDYRAVRYGRDINGLVGAGSQPIIVSNETIESLKSWAGEDQAIFTIAQTQMAPGDKVKITEGPMQGLDAIFLEETSQSERVTILLNLMDSEARAQIDRSQIERVSQ